MRSSPYWPVLHNPQAVPVGGLTEVPSRELLIHCWTCSVCVCQTTGQHALWQEATQLTVSLDLVEAATPRHMLVSLIRAHNGHEVCDATSIHWQAVGGRQVLRTRWECLSRAFIGPLNGPHNAISHCVGLCPGKQRVLIRPLSRCWCTLLVISCVCPVPWLCNRFPISASHPAPPIASSGAGTG